MERLPDELVLHVLDRLPARDLLRARRVCRRLRALLRRRLLVLRAPGDLPRHDAAASLRALLVCVRLPLLYETLQLAPRLRHLTLHAAAPLDERDLRALAGLRHLDHLDAFTCARAVDASLAPAAARLRCLVLNEHAAPAALRALAAAASRLRALHMFGRALHYPPRALSALLAARAPHLRELTLRCTELHDRHYAIVAGCPNLVELQLYSCWMLRRAGALRLARLGALRRLHVTGARMLRPRALGEFLRALASDLRSLALSATWFGDEHVPALGAQRGLRALEAWRARLTARGAARLAAALPALRSLDVDVPLPGALLAELHLHPALERLRCRADPDEPAPAPAVHARGLRVLTPADARGGRVAQRGGGEGYAGEVFYYWQQHDELEPLAVAWRTPLLVYVFDKEVADCDR